MAKDKKEKPTAGTAEVLDFSNVKEGGGSFNKKRLPEGDYKATVTDVKNTKASTDGTKMWLFTIETEKGGGKYPYYCKLQENQLWKVRNLLVAAGLEVPKKKMKVDPTRLVGKVIGITLVDGEYDGKKQSEIDAIFEASEVSGNDEDVDDADEAAEASEKPKKDKKKKDKKKKDDDDEMTSISTKDV